MTVDDVSSWFGVSRERVFNWRNKKLLVPTRVTGRTPLFASREVRMVPARLANITRTRRPSSTTPTPPTAAEVEDLDRYVTEHGYGVELARRWGCTRENVRQKMHKTAYRVYYYARRKKEDRRYRGVVKEVA
jgi:hypothetical protein